MGEEQTYSPFVYWAQTENEITLRVELRNVKSPKIDISEFEVEFSSIGVGALGETNYSFHLELSDSLCVEKSKYRISDRQIDFNLKKADSVFWPRLLKDPKKLAWLKIDFEKWCHEEDLEDEARDIMDDYPELYKEIQDQEMEWTSKRDSIKKVYMFLYNLWQFVGFIYIFSIMVARYMKDGPDSMKGTYEAISWMMKLCFTCQVLEILYPIVGYTKGSVVDVFIQIAGRSFIFFGLIVSESRMHEKPVIFYLFLVWSFIELIRYPFYMMKVYDIEVGLVTWLRYTVWIPLYPLGFLCEGVVILRCIPYFEETQRFTVSLPNSWNFTFHFPTLLRCYLLFFFFPVLYKMMNHMYRQRTKKIGPRNKKGN